MACSKTCPRGLDLVFGRGTPFPRRSFNALAWLEVFVDLKEMLNLEPIKFRNMMNVA